MIPEQKEDPTGGMHIQVTVSIGFETYISHAGEAARFTLSSTLLQTNVMKVEHHKFPEKTWILIFTSVTLTGEVMHSGTFYQKPKRDRKRRKHWTCHHIYETWLKITSSIAPTWRTTWHGTSIFLSTPPTWQVTTRKMTEATPLLLRFECFFVFPPSLSLYNIYIYMTVCRKACSQNRPNNAFPCVTPLLVNKKHTCLTIISNLQTKPQGLNFPATAHLRGLFQFQSNESEDEVELLLRDMTSLLAFFCLSFTAMRCRPFLLRCVDKFLWYFASFLPKEVIICSGVPFLTSPKCIFLLARGLRAACARNAT